MSKKRPGVDAAVQLFQSQDKSLWEEVYSRHQHVIECIPRLVDLDATAEALGNELLSETTKTMHITKKELMDIVIPWKFAVGKPRPALLGQLRSNSEQAVQTATQSGIAFARKIATASNGQDDVNNYMQKAIEAIAELKGVGPATASVVLSLVRPDIFCYMYDEVIDCFLPKRTYTLKVYLECRSKCQEQADLLGWTPEKIARTLWTAARDKAMGNGPAHDARPANKRSKQNARKEISTSTESSPNKAVKRRRSSRGI
jgi:hypothetical protein